jgi:hypothetical protein
MDHSRDQSTPGGSRLFVVVAVAVWLAALIVGFYFIG